MTRPVDSRIEALIDGALRKAVIHNGPIKLYHGSSGMGLFDRTRLANRARWEGVERRYWNEQRQGQFLSLRLISCGLDHLIEITAPEERSGLIESASEFYHRQLLKRWWDLAVARKWELDFPLIKRGCFQLIGDILELIDDIGHHLPEGKAEENLQSALVAKPRLSSQEADFKRRTAHELVIAWKHAPTTEAKHSIAAALRNSGIRQIGTPRETLPMDGGLHRCVDPAFPGDKVEVIECGWLVHDGVGEYLLEKATVKLL